LALSTRYDYDSLKQIAQVTDDQNNLTQVTYDKLGRRTDITNPDTGHGTTVYDSASNAMMCNYIKRLEKTRKTIVLFTTSRG